MRALRHGFSLQVAVYSDRAPPQVTVAPRQVVGNLSALRADAVVIELSSAIRAFIVGAQELAVNNAVKKGLVRFHRSFSFVFGIGSPSVFRPVPRPALRRAFDSY